MKVHFLSNCYEGEKTEFVIYVEGQEDDYSEEFVVPLLEEENFKVVAEDLYYFPGQTPSEAHSTLEKYGFVYGGPCDNYAMDTAGIA